jgi:hypothetical protein
VSSEVFKYGRRSRKPISSIAGRYLPYNFRSTIQQVADHFVLLEQVFPALQVFTFVVSDLRNIWLSPVHSVLDQVLILC